MNRTRAFLCLCFLGLFFSASGQEVYNSSGKKGAARYTPNRTKSGFDPNRLIFGGGFDAGAFNGTFGIGASPIVGYRITNAFSAGVQLGYFYRWVKDGQRVIDGQSGQLVYKNLNYHILSPSIWTRLIVIDQFFLHGEYEHNFFTYRGYLTTNNGVGARRQWDNAPSLLLGAGLRQPITETTSFVMVAYYDVLQNIPMNQREDEYGRTYSISPYAGTLGFKFGINVGF